MKNVFKINSITIVIESLIEKNNIFYPENALNHLRKNIFACLFSVHNRIILSRHEQVCLMRLRFERYFSHHRAM